jgi:hypothetical protein
METNTVVEVPLPEEKKLGKLAGVGDLLEQSAKIYHDHLYLILGILAMILVPVIILSVLIASSVSVGHFSNSIILAMVIIGIAFVFFTAWMEAALVKSIYYIVINKPITIKEAYMGTQKIVLRILAVMGLNFLVVFGGFMLLIIPGIIVSVWFSKSVYVSIVEDTSAKKSLEKSREYVRGRFWPVVGRALAVAVISMLISVFLAVLLVLIMGSGPGYKLAHRVIYYALWTPFHIIYSFLVYWSLKNTYVEKLVK